MRNKSRNRKHRGSRGNRGNNDNIQIPYLLLGTVNIVFPQNAA